MPADDASSRELAREAPDDRPVWDVLLGLFGCPSVLVSRDVGLYAALAAAPRSFDEIREHTKLAERPLRVLVALNAAAGLVVESNGALSLSSAARAYLLDESPTSFAGFLELVRSMYGMYSVEGLAKVVRDDRPAMYGSDDTFETHERRADLARAFTRAMHGISAGPAGAWPTRVDLSGVAHMLDLGGGSGAHAVAAAQAYPSLRATVIDLAPVCEVARETAARAGVATRVDAVAGDLFSSALPPADAHFYSMIFHDWPAEKCRALAKRSFDALPPGGRIFVHEMLLDDDRRGPLAVAAFGVSMLFGTQGEQYSARELSGFLADAGFVDARVVKTIGYWAVIEARRP